TPLVVMATKGSGTVRPFVRLNLIDLLLYQALVDALAPTIEGALLERDCVFAYRQSQDSGESDPFAGSPRWTEFMAAARSRLEASPDAYCVRADISGYFMQVDATELERSLLEAGASGPLARDVGELLRLWDVLGVRGLPQGIQPSSPLGN